jgi:D-serine dehydratase
MASPPPSPPRQGFTVIEDEHSEVRHEMLRNTKYLTMLVHYQATVKPHLEKLKAQIISMSIEQDNLEKANAKLTEEVEAMKKKQGDQAAPAGDRESKIQEILSLEKELEKLLAEKADLLARDQS